MPGVVYLDHALGPELLRKVRGHWPGIAQASLVLFNHLWFRLPSGQRAPLLKLAERRHVMVADCFDLDALRESAVDGHECGSYSAPPSRISHIRPELFQASRHCQRQRGHRF